MTLQMIKDSHLSKITTLENDSHKLSLAYENGQQGPRDTLSGLCF